LTKTGKKSSKDTQDVPEFFNKDWVGFTTDPELEEVHKFARNNKQYLDKAELCYCFYCLKDPFSPSLIAEWIDTGVTALCPFCGIDAIIPCGIKIKTQNIESLEFRQRMYKYWFVDDEGKVYILKDGQIVEVPCNI